MPLSAVVLELCDKAALVIALCSIAWHWQGTIRLSTVDPVTLFRRSWTLLARSHRLPVAIIALFVCCLILFECLSNRRWIALPFTLLGVALLTTSALLLPPTVMVLGVSRTVETRQLVNDIAKRIAPLQLVHFLARRGAWSSLFFLSNFYITNARTRTRHRWQDSVKIAASFVPFIVVDARVTTDSVEEESLEVIEPELIEKAVFIGAEDSPVLTRIATRLRVSLPALRVASADQVNRWMMDLPWEIIRKRTFRRGNLAEKILIGARRKVDQTQGTICEEIRRRLTDEPLDAEELIDHFRHCSICRPSGTPSTITSLHNGQEVDPATLPLTTIVHLDGFVDSTLLRKITRDPETGLIVFLANSPAGRHTRWFVDVIKLFALDSQLGLVVEKDTIQPITYDPAIAVRRNIVEGWEPSGLSHLAEISQVLAIRAMERGYKVRYEPLIELPRGRATLSNSKKRTGL